MNTTTTVRYVKRSIVILVSLVACSSEVPPASTTEPTHPCVETVRFDMGQLQWTNEFGFDALGRVIRREQRGREGQLVETYTATYGGDGKLLQETTQAGIDATEAITAYAHTDDGYVAITMESGLEIERVEVTLNDAGDPVSVLSHSEQRETTYVYDELGRLVRLRVGYANIDSVSITTYHYDEASRLIRTEEMYGAGLENHVLYMYEGSQLIRKVSADPDTGEPVGRGEEYEYDARGRRVRIISWRDATTIDQQWDYTYDCWNT